MKQWYMYVYKQTFSCGVNYKHPIWSPSILLKYEFLTTHFKGNYNTYISMMWHAIKSSVNVVVEW